MKKSILTALLIPFLLTACITYRMLSGGQKATDLSWLHTGVVREHVEDILGKPVLISSSENGIIAVYEYDQGYEYEEEEEAFMRWTSPVILMYEVGTAGMLSVLEAEMRQCQRGLLRVLFDASGIVKAAGECYATVDDVDCNFTRRPSTLSEEFKNNPPNEVSCNYSISHQ